MQGKIGDSIIISGNLPRDAEFLIVGQKETPLCKFGVKVGERGENREAIWVNCVCWQRVAEAARGLCKGDAILAIGKITTREYQGRDGETKTSVDLVCEFICKMPGQSPQKQYDGCSDASENLAAEEPDDGDLPF